MLVHVVAELAAEVVRPAASAADTACATPPEVLRAADEVGLALLGVPESRGGLSEERTAMTGALVAEALAHGDLGIAVATLAPGSVATAISLWGTDEQQATYLRRSRALADQPTLRPPRSRSPSRPSCSTRSPPRPRPPGPTTGSSSTA